MNRNRKSVVVYVFVALFAFVFDKIYSLFSHGVESKAMSSIWIFLLCFGAGFYLFTQLICGIAKKRAPYRVSMNIYNSGIAVYAVGMLLQGILEIAGTGSDFIIYYRLLGILLMIIGFISLYCKIFHSNKDKRS